MFDVEPSSAATDAAPPQCAPPSAEAVALLNAADIRAPAGDGGEGEAGASGEAAAEGGQKVTPWEVEVRNSRDQGGAVPLCVFVCPLSFSWVVFDRLACVVACRFRNCSASGTLFLHPGALDRGVYDACRRWGGPRLIASAAGIEE